MLIQPKEEHTAVPAAAVTAAQPKPERKRNQRGEGEKLRGEIIDAALRLLDQQPHSELSLRAVAREVGVTAPAIYPHFPRREDMIAEVVRVSWAGLAREMERADARARGKSPRDRLKAQARAYIRYATASPTRYETLFGFQNRYMVSTVFDETPAAGAIRAVRAAVVRCIDAGYVPIMPANDLALLILSFLHGRVALAQSTPGWRFSTPQSVTRLVEDAISAVLAAPSGA